MPAKLVNKALISVFIHYQILIYQSFSDANNCQLFFVDLLQTLIKTILYAYC